MDESLLRFSSGPQQGSPWFSSALTAVLGLGLAFTALAGLMLPGLPGLQSLTPADGLLFGGWLTADALAYLSASRKRALEEPLPVGAALILSALLQLGLVYHFVYLGGEGLHGLLKSLCLSGLFTLLFWIPLLLRSAPGRPSVPAWRDMAFFGTPLMTAALFYALINNLDRWILNRHFGEAATGLYGLAFRLGMGTLLLVNAFKLGWYPRLYARMAAGGPAAATALARKTLHILIPAVGSGGLFIALFIPEIAGITVRGKALIAPEYWSAFPVVAIVALAFVFDAAVTIADSLLYYERRVRRVLACVALGAAVNLAANLCLIPGFGAQGAAFALVLSYAVILAAIHRTTMRTLGLRVATIETAVQLCYFSLMLFITRLPMEFSGRALLFGGHVLGASVYLLVKIRHGRPVTD